jgi:hypothetical protein
MALENKSGSIHKANSSVSILAGKLVGHLEKTGSHTRKTANQMRMLLKSHDPVHHVGFFTACRLLRPNIATNKHG